MAGKKTAAEVSELSESDAEDLTERINTASDQLCWLVYEAHGRKVWKALGHKSFKDWAIKRLVMSEVQAHRLLNQAKAILDLEEAAGLDAEDATNPWVSHPWGHVSIPERQLRDLKPRMDEVVAAVRDAVKDHPDNTDAATDAAIDAVYQVVEQQVKLARDQPSGSGDDDLPVKIRRALNGVLNLIPEQPDDATRLAWQNAVAMAEEVKAAIDRVLALQGDQPKPKRIRKSPATSTGRNEA
jgi:hypothetical protein